MICRIVSITKKEIAGHIDGDGGKKNVVGIAAVHDFFANKSNGMELVTNTSTGIEYIRTSFEKEDIAESRIPYIGDVQSMNMRIWSMMPAGISLHWR